MLGLQVAHQLLLRDLDPEMPEQLADETRVLDLLDRARRPEERLIVVANVRGDRVRVREPVPSQRSQPRSVTCLDQLRVVNEVHERVAPVEENSPQHGCLG